MSDSRDFKPFFLTTISFISGLAAGLLLTPKTGRKKQRFQSTPQSRSGISRFREKLGFHRGPCNLQELQRRIHQEIRQNIPDAYEATEYIPLSEREMRNG